MTKALAVSRSPAPSLGTSRAADRRAGPLAVEQSARQKPARGITVAAGADPAVRGETSERTTLRAFGRKSAERPSGTGERARRWQIAIAICVLGALPARSSSADPDAVATVTASGTGSAAPPKDSLIYVEALGKAGPYGVGYEHAISERIALGFEGSVDRLREQNLAAAVPYVHVTPLVRGANALFGELGMELAYSKIESGVARWMGTSTTAVGAVAAAGYQRDLGKRFVLRIALSVLAGKGGAAPWGGIAIGVKP